MTTTETTTEVYLDDDVCERADADRYGLGLTAVRIEGHWNGFAIPVTTAAEFRRFVGAWSSNDPNGAWAPQGIGEVGRFLVYDDGESDEPQVWQAIDERTADGAALYELAGWTWHA
jgi:hypothetical protein